MEKTKFAYCADEILRFVAIWIFSVICLRYLLQKLYLIIISATAITLLITLLIRLYLKKKNKTVEQQRRRDAAMSELLTIDRDVLLRTISAAVGGTRLGEAVLSKNTLIYPYFWGELSLDKLNEAYNLALGKHKRLLILCISMQKDAEKNLPLFCETPVVVLKKEDSCAFLSKYDLLPKCKERPKKRRSLIAIALQRSKLKGYLLASVVLLLSAAFSPYSILCIVMAAFNIAMSVLCEIKGK